MELSTVQIISGWAWFALCGVNVLGNLVAIGSGNVESPGLKAGNLVFSVLLAVWIAGVLV